MVLEVMIQNNDYETPTERELEEWADAFGLTVPVLADEGQQVISSYANGEIGLPYIVVMDRGVVIEKIGDGTERDAEKLL